MTGPFVFLFMFIVCSSTGSLAQKACSKDPLEDMDSLIASIMPFNNPKMKAPQKLEDLPQFCSYFVNALSQVDNLNKRCVKESYKNLISVVLIGIRKHSKDICSKKSLASNSLTPKKKSFLQLGSCIQSGTDKLKKCAVDFKTKVLGIQNAQKDKKLSLVCCELNQIKKCIVQTLTQQPGCDSEQSAQKVREFVANFGTNSLASVCGEFENEDKCKGLVYPKKKKSQRMPKSFIMPVLAVISSV